jgi:hypothetical protein
VEASGTTSTPATHETDGTVHLANLKSGTYHYTVNLLLTDGGTATASGSFTVNAGPAGQTACTNFGGTFAAGTGGIIWTCTKTVASQTEIPNGFPTLFPSCQTDGGTLLLAVTPPQFPAPVAFTCE